MPGYHFNRYKPLILVHKYIAKIIRYSYNLSCKVSKYSSS